jgi:hypothetical protein
MNLTLADRRAPGLKIVQLIEQVHLLVEFLLDGKEQSALLCIYSPLITNA